MARSWFKRKKRRILVIGLDGVPYTLLNNLCEKGHLRWLDDLKRSGFLLRMNVSLPEISAVSWSSFMTGTNPGFHGIYGFTDFERESYKVRYPNFSDLKMPTLWDELGKFGKKSVVINQPSTYPAREIPGILVSGFVAIELSKAVNPLRYLATLRRMNYIIDIDTHRCRLDQNQMFLELNKSLDVRKEAFNFFFDELDWDYFQVVITGTDRLHHYLWDSVVNESHPRHIDSMAYYARVEEFIRFAYEKFFKDISIDREGEGFYLLSDHGFCGVEKEVYINSLLRKWGYLSFGSKCPESLEEISDDTKAFALEPSRIYLNKKKRFPRGILDDEQAEMLRLKLKEKFLSLEFEGRKVLRNVFFKEEIYSGPQLESAPDIVLLSHYGFDLKGSINNEESFGNSDLKGMHTYDDAFFWSKNIARNNINITELKDIFQNELLG